MKNWVKEVSGGIIIRMIWIMILPMPGLSVIANSSPLIHLARLDMAMPTIMATAMARIRKGMGMMCIMGRGFGIPNSKFQIATR